MRLHPVIAALLLLSAIGIARAEFADAPGQMILFQSGRATFNGILYKPNGKGPFPVVIWNHGHHEHLNRYGAKDYNDLGKLYTREGFVLLVPDRHERDISRTEYSQELQKMLERSPKGPETKEKQAAENIEINARDVASAIDWAKSQPFIDATRIALSGWSSGATASLVVAEKNRDVKALVLFSPALKQWKSNMPLQASLRRAARNCPSPIFFIQAQDDPTPEPVQILGKEIEHKPQPNKTHTYAHTGYDKFENTSLAINGTDAWGYDVLRFLETVMKD